MRLLALVALSSIVVSAAPPAAEVQLAIRGRTNSTPWVAAAGSFVAVAWGAAADGNGDVFLAVSRDGGGTFGAPVMVNTVAGDARISGEIPPRVVVRATSGAVPDLWVAWNARDGGTSIRAVRSRDGGRTFTAPTTLQAPGAAGDRGWHASTLDAGGNLHTIWLDHRELAADKDKHSGHKGEHDGVAMAQKSSLYYGPARAGAERQLFKGVCYCCKSAMVATPDGALMAAWRHVFEGNMRDIAFTVSRDGGKSFSPLARVHEDKWSINGCPDDGPAMAVDAAGTVHLVWPTVLNGTEGALHYAMSTDGRSFTPPVRVPTLGSPKPSHPQIAIDAKGRVMIAWDEVVNGVRTAAGRPASSRNGRVEFGDLVRLGDGAGTYPVIAATSRGWVAVWSTGGPTSVIRASRLN
jgi:hypothetical protein